ncbi:MAG: hypothetical protein ACRCYV_04135 [Aeromonas sp.]
MSARFSRDGFAPASINARLKLDKASGQQLTATLRLRTQRVPFSRIKYRSERTDSSGTRARISVRRGGQRVVVYGFVNPYGKKKKPLVRGRKNGRSTLVKAGGVGLKAWWLDAVDERYSAQLSAQLTRRVRQHLTEGT